VEQVAGLLPLGDRRLEIGAALDAPALRTIVLQCAIKIRLALVGGRLGDFLWCRVIAHAGTHTKQEIHRLLR